MSTETEKSQTNNASVTPSFEDTVERAKARLKFIDEVGKKTPGVSLHCSPLYLPSWYKRETFQRAQKLYSTFASVYDLFLIFLIIFKTYILLIPLTRICYSQFYGLLTVYNVFEGLAPLLCTGNSSSVPILFTRYLSTVVQVKSWFEGDPFDRNSKAYRSLKVVRSYHHQVASKLNEGKEGQELWMSQWSMMSAQFTFMGYMTVFPKEVLFKNAVT